MQIIVSVHNLDGGAWRPGDCAPRNQWQICVVGEFLIALRDRPGEFGDPQIDEFAVVKLNVPRVTSASLDPVELARLYNRVQRV